MKMSNKNEKKLLEVAKKSDLVFFINSLNPNSKATNIWDWDISKLKETFKRLVKENEKCKMSKR